MSREQFEAWMDREYPDRTDQQGKFRMSSVRELMEAAWKASAEAEREACAKACDTVAENKWALYKGRAPCCGNEDGRAHPQTQGESIGAEECAAAIRAR